MAPILLAALLVAPSADAVSAETVIGRWRTQTRNGIIEIAHCGASLCGTLIGSDGLTANPALADTKNQDATLRGRPLKGITMLSGFARDGTVWAGGSVYNPEDGGTYHGKLTPTDADHLTVRGCIVWPLCKTQTWTRVR